MRASISSSSKVIPLDELAPLILRARNAGQIIVFTNGCFDLLHLGHVQYLEDASLLGDILVVGLNSDSSTRRLKGERRPLIPEKERARILAALSCVDYVVVFDDSTAEQLVEVLQPDIYVKGGDYSPDSDIGGSADDQLGKLLPEGDIVRRYGGKVTVIPFLLGHSTTDLINQVLKKYSGN